MNITQKFKTSLAHRGLAASIFVATLSLAATAKAQILFKDTFTTSAQSIDVNFEIPGVRQTGTQVGGGVPYIDTDSGGGGYHTQVNEGSFPQALFIFTDGAAPSGQTVTLNKNFNTFGAISVSLDALHSNMRTSDFVGLEIGGNGGLNPVYTGNGGFGLLLRPQFNAYEVYFNGVGIASGTNLAISSTLTNSILGTISAFGGNPATASFSVNGIQLYSGSPGSFANDFVSISAGGFSGNTTAYGFDNLTVQAVPEPATYAMVGMLVLGALVSGRKVRARRLTAVS